MVYKKRSLDSPEARSAYFLRMRSPKRFFVGGVRFSLDFFSNLKLMIASIFLANFRGAFALLTQH